MKKEQELGIDLKRTISQKYPFWVLVIIFIAAFSFGFVFNSLMLLNSTDRIDYMESLLKQHSTPQGVDYGYHFIINGSMTLEGLSRIYFTPQINPQARSILESQINKICKMAVKSKDLTAVPQSGTGGKMIYPKHNMIRTARQRFAYWVFMQKYIFVTGKDRTVGWIMSMVPEFTLIIMAVQYFGIYDLRSNPITSITYGDVCDMLDVLHLVSWQDVSEIPA